MSPRSRLTLHASLRVDGPGRSSALEPLGFLAQLCLAARTAEDALRTSCELAPLWSSLTPKLVHEREHVTLRAVLPALRTCDAEPAPLALLKLWLALAEGVAQRRVYPQAVRVPTLADELRDELRRAVSCVVYAGESMVSISFLAADLADANPCEDPRLYQLLREYADERLEHHEAVQSTKTRLHHALRALDDVSQASAESLATALGFGVRTLHRRLRAEGSSYRQVFEDFRMQRCLSQVRGSSVPVKRIAYTLGFSSPASFHRAFRRWTGTTVSAYRRESAQPVAAPLRDKVAS